MPFYVKFLSRTWVLYTVLADNDVYNRLSFTSRQQQHLDVQQETGRLPLTAHNLPLTLPIPSMPE